jgi:hypothetical protein
MSHGWRWDKKIYGVTLLMCAKPVLIPLLSIYTPFCPPNTSYTPCFITSGDQLCAFSLQTVTGKILSDFPCHFEKHKIRIRAHIPLFLWQKLTLRNSGNKIPKWMANVVNVQMKLQTELLRHYKYEQKQITGYHERATCVPADEMTENIPIHFTKAWTYKWNAIIQFLALTTLTSFWTSVNLSKCCHIQKCPQDRLYQFIP